MDFNLTDTDYLSFIRRKEVDHDELAELTDLTQGKVKQVIRRIAKRRKWNEWFFIFKIDLKNVIIHAAIMIIDEWLYKSVSPCSLQLTQHLVKCL